jgi:hypothetical protein
MDFLVYAFAGVGVVASAWFLAIAAAKAWPGKGASLMDDLESRISDLERRVP